MNRLDTLSNLRAHRHDGAVDMDSPRLLRETVAAPTLAAALSANGSAGSWDVGFKES